VDKVEKPETLGTAGRLGSTSSVDTRSYMASEGAAPWVSLPFTVLLGDCGRTRDGLSLLL
jgi:hypothetical protein